MISILRGTVASVGLDYIDLLVGGIGFRVHVTPAFAQGAKRDQEMTAFTSMIVREDSMTLYGFDSVDGRDVFTKLLSVSGIGPKIALAALAVLHPDDLRRAVRDQDLAALQRIPGVGKKSAQRMALEIGDKLGTPAALPGAQAGLAPAPTEDAVASEVRAALVGLGWTEAQAAKAIEKLAGSGLGASDMLRAALVTLGGGRG
ncbi:Holliday junction branch migration protein RuvA [Schaalia odontolytica]|uniref:Holliday junction branch migration complex subunit RuvA n=1 Tax=Schaalia odontolytica TaxID=1660 RepID=A0A2X0U1Z0_9ACTO|nr:Holliday junction branch migration protein RuvA [Schaalia odontolytica]WMS27310.1 Holliday junction branch migration protein RuvA [Schaalia odontolytica]SPT56153.1 Holliday junction ATP-dependent DNA helicase RuvA [Schaalia odontolytica]